MDDRGLRRPALVAIALAVGCIAVPVLVFALILDPGGDRGCSTELPDGTYADLLLPVHVAAFAVLAATALWLGARRSPGGRVPRQVVLPLVVLAAVLACALISDWMAALIGAAAVLAIIPLALALAVNGLVEYAAGRRRARTGEARDEAQRWEDRARAAQGLLWAALAIGVPASYAIAYVNGASLFCF